MKKVLAVFVLGTVLAFPTAASAQGSPGGWHHGPTITPMKWTATEGCAYATPADMTTPIPVTITYNLVNIVPYGATEFTPWRVVGEVTVTGPTGIKRSYFDFYLDTPIGNPPEVQGISGWALVSNGAFAGPVTYLSPGTADVDHYGSAFLLTGHMVNVCSAVGA